MNVGSSDHFTFNTHPKVNKAVYDKSSLLQLKDTTKGSYIFCISALTI